jgi:hypothetical protein
MAKESKKKTPQERYFAEKKNEGLTRVTAWVPPEDRVELLSIAKDMRADYLRKPEAP